MHAVAFVSAFTPSLHLCSSSQSLSHSPSFPRPLLPRITRRRVRVPVTHACAPSPPPCSAHDDHRVDDPALYASYQLLAQQVAVAVAGVYAAMCGASPAGAVPAALVEAFKSKPASLAHPTLMWVLLGTCGYTFYLGYQNSRIRQVEPAERKELVKGRFGERHFKTSSLLFATMTVATFSGMANTYARTGKLFPGPHLYAGLGLVATMSIMAAFVPYMQKGKDWARNAHFSVAFAALGLFGWQAKSGMAIVGKLLGWN